MVAAVVARAGGWPLSVFVPPEADPAVLCRLRELADVVTCPREPGVLGDPAYLRLREELDRGALPFTAQGNENGLAVEGGETLGYELVTDLAGGTDGGLDHLVVQVGGGALASSCLQALSEAAGLGALGRLPRVHTVQTFGAHPLERAYHRVRALLPDDPGPDAVREAMAKASPWASMRVSSLTISGWPPVVSIPSTTARQS